VYYVFILLAVSVFMVEIKLDIHLLTTCVAINSNLEGSVVDGTNTDTTLTLAGYRNCSLSIYLTVTNHFRDHQTVISIYYARAQAGAQIEKCLTVCFKKLP
jgi:hypothetical protein